MKQHKPTSKEGEDFIKPFKQTHYQKILDGLYRLRIGGTHEELSLVCGLRPDQVWKRLSELEREERIFNTGITRKLRSGVGGIVWQLKGMKVIGASKYPTTQRQVEANKIIKQMSMYDR